MLRFVYDQILYTLLESWTDIQVILEQIIRKHLNRSYDTYREQKTICSRSRGQISLRQLGILPLILLDVKLYEIHVGLHLSTNWGTIFWKNAKQSLVAYFIMATEFIT